MLRSTNPNYETVVEIFLPFRKRFPIPASPDATQNYCFYFISKKYLKLTGPNQLIFNTSYESAKVSYITAATMIPETNVNPAIARIAEGTPSVSARMPEASAPIAYPPSRHKR